MRSSHKLVAFLPSLFGKLFDIIEPGKHRIVRLGPEYPSVATVHRTSLSALEHEFV
jgi:hypothetical protein